MEQKVRGVIYDLDGTAIKTESVHEEGWKYAAYMFNVGMTQKMLLDQKGMSGREFAKGILPENLQGDIDLFLNAKHQYVYEHLGEISFCQGFLEAQEALKDIGIPIWICTAARRSFVNRCFLVLPELERFSGRTVTSELYEHGKPSPEPLQVTQFLMGNFLPEELVYIGDAYADYLSAKNANMRFIYFASESSRRDERIPENISTIQDHREVLKLIK